MKIVARPAPYYCWINTLAKDGIAVTFISLQSLGMFHSSIMVENLVENLVENP
jgi:hypothetical protein